MTAKEYLSQYRDEKLKVERMGDQIKELEALSEYASPRFSTSSSKISDKVGNNAAKIADKKKELERLISKSLELMKEIEACINRVKDERYRYILTERYINQQKWESIAEGLGELDLSWVHKLHGRALEKIDH